MPIDGLHELVSTYLKNLAKAANAPGATPELSLRPTLDHLLQQFLILANRENLLTLSNEATTAGVKGRPDFILYRSESPCGYIEAESIDSNLRKLTGHAKHQNDHYTKNLDNFILTNHLDFELWHNGEKIATASLPDPRDGDTSPSGSDLKKLEHLLEQFSSGDHITLPPLKSPKDLANALARRTRQLNESIHHSLLTNPTSYLHNLKSAFEKELLPNLSEDEFADLYAQTIAYGLFAARCAIQNDEQAAHDFDRQHAAEFIPPSNPFLADLFEQITSRKLDADIRWITDDIARLLRAAPYVSVRPHSKILTKREDPVIHFYETFLASYNPKLREQRGVYYTPEPVVSYIIRSVDELLKDRLGRTNGLADDSVKILDPATGTGTFLAQTILHIFEQYEKAGNQGLFTADYIENKLLPRLFGFELMVAPYTVAHLKLHLLLKDLCPGYKPKKRLEVYLTNTLEPPQIHPELPLAEYISKENNAAAQIKGTEDILVIIGNPPYSGHSANASKIGTKYTPIGGLLHGIDPIDPRIKNLPDYFKCDGKPLGERNPKWLNDDYVKFIRFSQWRIDRTGEGILGFITNHGFLDNPTFRGMRQALMQSFSEIHLLDLHGNDRKKEIDPATGLKDENVFDIQQGVAILLAVKKKGHQKGDPCQVFHKDLYGKRQIKESNKRDAAIVGGKYGWLWENSISLANYSKVEVTKPHYRFVYTDMKEQNFWQSAHAINQIFNLSLSGIKTHRDQLVTDFERETLISRIESLKHSSEIETPKLRGIHNLKDNSEWKFDEARKSLDNIDIALETKEIQYRPFDKRSYFRNECLTQRPRRELMRHLDFENQALATIRNLEIPNFDHVFCTETLTDHHAVSLKEANYFFPLYLYPAENTPQAADPEKYRRPNFSEDFLKPLASALGTKRHLSNNAEDQALSGMMPADGEDAPLPYDEATGQYYGLPKGVSPEDIFHYLYAILHSPTYRKRYADFLKIDFPRIPLPKGRKMFEALLPHGKQLTALHLLDVTAAPVLLEPRHPFPVQGDNTVHHKFGTKAHPGWKPAKNQIGHVYLNDHQRIENVPLEIWQHTIGGYQPAEKWLKDRRERTLTTDDIQHYQRMLIAIAETQQTMQNIDAIVAKYTLFEE